MTEQNRRPLYEGYGDTLSRATAWALVPAIFAVVGHWLDGRLGTGPWIAVGFGVWAVTGMFIVTWLEYRSDLDAEVPSVVRDRPQVATQVRFEVPVAGQDQPGSAA